MKILRILIVLMFCISNASIADSERIDALILQLKDENYNIRSEAARGLAKIGESAVEPLIILLKGEEDYDRALIIDALGWIRDKRAVEPLIGSLDDKNRFVRIEAARALGWIGDGQAVEPLITALGDKDWSVRGVAEAALGKIGDKRAVEPLITALQNEIELNKITIITALGMIGDKRAVKPLINTLKYNLFQPVTIEALVNIGKPAIKPLETALKDENSNIREGVKKALERIRDKQSNKSLKPTWNKRLWQQS